MRRILLFGLIVAMSLASAGCGGSRERGKNADQDRPATQKK